MKKFILLFLMIFTGSPVEAQTQTAERYQKVMQTFVEAYNSGNYEGIQALFNTRMQTALPLEKSKAFFQKNHSQFGKIIKIEPPRLSPPNRAIFLAQCEKGTLDITLILDAGDKIAGLGLEPPSLPILNPTRNQTRLSLPFRGRWRVANGGDTKELNAHHAVPNQRFAFDFDAVDELGNRFKEDGKRNEDYYSFGQEILSPGDGIITDVIQGVRDNIPGSTNPYSALGNAVFIQHHKDEISVLAHLKQGSIRVEVGEKVISGQVIGLSGNSGNSTGPHLHYHLQNTPIIQDAEGIKCYFQDVMRVRDNNTEEMKEYSPIQSDIVCSKKD